MDDPRAVLAQLPACVVHHPAKLKELRTQWDHHCAKILQDAHLTKDQKIKVTMDWLAKANIRDFVLGKLVLAFARPLPAIPTDEKRKERRQRALKRLVYTDDIPHLRAVNRVVAERLEDAPRDTQGSLAFLDSHDDRERETPGTMFAEFSRSIDEQVAIEYQAAQPSEPFVDAAE